MDTLSGHLISDVCVCFRYKMKLDFQNSDVTLYLSQATKEMKYSKYRLDLRIPKE